MSSNRSERAQRTLPLRSPPSYLHARDAVVWRRMQNEIRRENLRRLTAEEENRALRSSVDSLRETIQLEAIRYEAELETEVLTRQNLRNYWEDIRREHSTLQRKIELLSQWRDLFLESFEEDQRGPLRRLMEARPSDSTRRAFELSAELALVRLEESQLGLSTIRNNFQREGALDRVREEWDEAQGYHLVGSAEEEEAEANLHGNNLDEANPDGTAIGAAEEGGDPSEASEDNTFPPDTAANRGDRDVDVNSPTPDRELGVCPESSRGP